MSDHEMIWLAEKYLRAVGELKRSYPTAEFLLQDCVDVYNFRKSVGLEQ